MASLTLEQKVQIITFVDLNPSQTRMAVKLHFEALFKTSINLNSMNRWIRDKEKHLSDFENCRNTSVKRVSKTKYPEIEELLIRWIDDMEGQNNPITDAIIQAIAESFARILKIDNFKLTPGTLGRFKTRNNLKKYAASGERQRWIPTHMNQI